MTGAPALIVGTARDGEQIGGSPNVFALIDSIMTVLAFDATCREASLCLAFLDAHILEARITHQGYDGHFGQSGSTKRKGATWFAPKGALRKKHKTGA